MNDGGVLILYWVELAKLLLLYYYRPCETTWPSIPFFFNFWRHLAILLIIIRHLNCACLFWNTELLHITYAWLFTVHYLFTTCTLLTAECNLSMLTLAESIHFSHVHMACLLPLYIYDVMKSVAVTTNTTWQLLSQNHASILFFYKAFWVWISGDSDLILCDLLQNFVTILCLMLVLR